MDQYKSLGVSPKLLDILAKEQVEIPTPLQEKTIPLMMKNKSSLLLQTQKNPDKAIAFGIPLMDIINPKLSHLQAIILVSSREKALEVSSQLYVLNQHNDLKLTTLYSGLSSDIKDKLSSEVPHILISTPQEVVDFIANSKSDLSHVSHVILHDADQILSSGYFDSTETILNQTPENRKLIILSDTLPSHLVNLAKRFMSDMEHISLSSNTPTNLTDQYYYEILISDKYEVLKRVIDFEPHFYGVIFCRTKVDVDQLTTKLTDDGYAVDGLHGDLSQSQRDKILRKFKTKYISILVSTDVATRGSDIKNLSCIVHYTIPDDTDSYLQRLSRTGTPERPGTSVSLVTNSDLRKINLLQRTTGIDIRKESIPSISEIIESKKDTILTHIDSIIKDQSFETYSEFADHLLEGTSAKTVVASLLKYAFKHQLDYSNYSPISDITHQEETSSEKIRLFIALGRKDGMSPKKVIELINDETKVQSHLIQEVRVLDSFSFITVPIKDGELIIDIFKKKRRGRSLVTKAKKKL